MYIRTIAPSLFSLIVLCCKEHADEHMPETMDAAALKEMCEKGDPGKCLELLPGVTMASYVAGAKIPIVLT